MRILQFLGIVWGLCVIPGIPEASDGSLAFSAPSVRDSEKSRTCAENSVKEKETSVHRMISRIECMDSCSSLSTSFNYDSNRRLSRISVSQYTGGREYLRTTVFNYTSSKISYVTQYYMNSKLSVRKDKGYVLMDKKGRAAKGSRMQVCSPSRWNHVFSVFQGTEDQISRAMGHENDSWVRYYTDYEYKYGATNLLRRVNQFHRIGNVESVEYTDLWWNVGNLSLASDTRYDYSYAYGRLPNKTNLDLNRYLAYFLADNKGYADTLIGLLGVYGCRSEQLCTEYSDADYTFYLQYELDEQGYVSRINVDRVVHKDLYSVERMQDGMLLGNGPYASSAILVQPQEDGTSSQPDAASSLAEFVRSSDIAGNSQHCTLVLTYEALQ